MASLPSKVPRNLSREEAFHFFTAKGNYTSESGASLEEFMQKAKDVDSKSL
jgi:hypothetical protein